MFAKIKGVQAESLKKSDSIATYFTSIHRPKRTSIRRLWLNKLNAYLLLIKVMQIQIQLYHLDNTTHKTRI